MARALIDPINLAQKTQISNADQLWSLIDYASLQGASRRRHSSTTATQAIPLVAASSNGLVQPDSAIFSSSPASVMLPSFGGHYPMDQHDLQAYLGDDMGGLWAEVFPSQNTLSGLQTNPHAHS